MSAADFRFRIVCTEAPRRDLRIARLGCRSGLALPNALDCLDRLRRWEDASTRQVQLRFSSIFSRKMSNEIRAIANAIQIMAAADRRRFSTPAYIRRGTARARSPCDFSAR